MASKSSKTKIQNSIKSQWHLDISRPNSTSMPTNPFQSLDYENWIKLCYLQIVLMWPYIPRSVVHISSSRDKLKLCNSSGVFFPLRAGGGAFGEIPLHEVLQQDWCSTSAVFASTSNSNSSSLTEVTHRLQNSRRWMQLWIRELLVY